MNERNEMVEKLEKSIEDGAGTNELKAILECLRIRSGAYGV